MRARSDVGDIRSISVIMGGLIGTSIAPEPPNGSILPRPGGRHAFAQPKRHSLRATALLTCQSAAICSHNWRTSMPARCSIAAAASSARSSR